MFGTENGHPDLENYPSVSKLVFWGFGGGGGFLKALVAGFTVDRVSRHS